MEKGLPYDSSQERSTSQLIELQGRVKDLLSSQKASDEVKVLLDVQSTISEGLGTLLLFGIYGTKQKDRIQKLFDRLKVNIISLDDTLNARFPTQGTPFKRLALNQRWHSSRSLLG